MRVGSFKFPVNLTPGQQRIFPPLGGAVSGQTGADMAAIGSGKADDATLRAHRQGESAVECVPAHDVYLDQDRGGMRVNAQPQRAEANINCRIMPGEPVESIQRKLEELVADPNVSLSMADVPGPQSPAPPLTPRVLQPVEKIVADMWPGVPVDSDYQHGCDGWPLFECGGHPDVWHFRCVRRSGWQRSARAR